jgi:diguanylate cyclase (GGDEF)-like protein
MGKDDGTVPKGQAVTGSGVPVSAKRRPVWAIVAGLLIVGGILSSVLAGVSLWNGDVARSHQAFEASSADIASTLELAIEHEGDLIDSADGFIAENPDPSNKAFLRWGTSVSALARYPELVGLGLAVVVPAAELPAFAERELKDPTGPLAANGTFEVEPAGARPFYCFVTAQFGRTAQSLFPVGDNLCSGVNRLSALLSSELTGAGAYTPIKDGASTLLSVQTPVYRGGTLPSSDAARRSAFLGWVGMALVPQVLLQRALQGHPHTSVTFRYRAGTSSVVFMAGVAPKGAQFATINLRNGWTVTASGPGAPDLLGSAYSLEVFLGGVLLSVLLGLLVLLLGTGRARALRVINEQTGELRHQALHDALTGLPNRALIMDRITQLLARNRRQGTAGAALFVDLDEFKNVNDSLGHEAGDMLLVAVAARLASTLRDADTIGRMGGDEFIVLIDGATTGAPPELVADRLLEVMRRPFELPGATMPLIVNASIGIAIGDRLNPGDLLRDADVALYEAKAAGKNRYKVFHPDMQSSIQHRIELEFELRSALEGEQFRLVYQPIYNLEDLSVVGVEALLRWEHPTRGFLQPDAFIPILEQTGQIREVGRWVLRHACQQMALWHAEGDTLDVSVNVSGRQLDDDIIVEHIREALSESELAAGSLIIEVTETALMLKVESTARRLAEIKLLGVRVAVDDFGTGYSSLAYLQQFPVDCLKIDRSFTSAITTSPESKALIGTLVQLGRDLGLVTLAEGVETTDQMDHLREEHVDQAQGFLLARPLDAAGIEAQILAPMRSTSRP